MARTVNNQQRLEKRNVILKEAKRQFPREGFSKTTLSSIGQAIGINPATILLYFPNKEDLFENTVKEAVQETRKGQFYLPESLELSEHLEQMVRHHVKQYREDPSNLRILQYLFSQSGRFPELQQEAVSITYEFVERMTGLLKKRSRLNETEQELRDKTWAYLSFLSGFTMIMLEPEKYPLWEGIVKQGIKLIET
ncbi:TetR/AcrR family transcriptional regulator [Lysinibacillus sp. NPDC095746]|uniref:TetR/AcrR family transcriptional regulator n=1 Tax=Lysinibacillus sp. NPDC095746 TaxID=3364134 RepID=UPI003829FB9A